jgi:hypothetical protein
MDQTTLSGGTTNASWVETTLGVGNPNVGTVAALQCPGTYVAVGVMTRASNRAQMVNNFALLCAPNVGTRNPLYIVSGGFFDDTTQTWHQPSLQHNTQFFKPSGSQMKTCPVSSSLVGLDVRADLLGVRKIERLWCQSNGISFLQPLGPLQQVVVSGSPGSFQSVDVNVGYDLGGKTFLGCPTSSQVDGFFERFFYDTRQLALHCRP